MSNNLTATAAAPVRPASFDDAAANPLPQFVPVKIPQIDKTAPLCTECGAVISDPKNCGAITLTADGRPAFLRRPKVCVLKNPKYHVHHRSKRCAPYPFVRWSPLFSGWYNWFVSKRAASMWVEAVMILTTFTPTVKHGEPLTMPEVTMRCERCDAEIKDGEYSGALLLLADAYYQASLRKKILLKNPRFSERHNTKECGADEEHEVWLPLSAAKWSVNNFKQYLKHYEAVTA